MASESGTTLLKVYSDDVSKISTYTLTVSAHFQSHGSSNSASKSFTVTIADHCETQFTGSIDSIPAETYTISYDALTINLPLAYDISPNYCDPEKYAISFDPPMEDADAVVFDQNQMTLQV